MATGASLSGSRRVRHFQNVLHAKAKEEPERRLHALVDKVWREDFLREAWVMVRRNGGQPGVDGESLEAIERMGVEHWLGELSRDLKDGTCTPQAVRQVLIPNKRPGRFRPLGIPTIRDRVAQTSALLVLAPIFEADLPREQYGYRPGRSAQDAVRRIHWRPNRGHNEVADGDLDSCCGEIPHAELIESVARRVSDGPMPGLVKAWLEMPVEEEDGKGGKRRTNRARRERKGTPQGSPLSPLLSNIYRRRFIPGWKKLGFAWRFAAEIVVHADDFRFPGKAPAPAMLAAVIQLTDVLKLTVNTRKTRCLRCPENSFEWNYRPGNGDVCIGNRPSKASVQSICRKISAQTHRRYGRQDPSWIVNRLNRMISGWAEYFQLARPAWRPTSMRRSGCDSGSVASTRSGTGSSCASPTSGCGTTTA